MELGRCPCWAMQIWQRPVMVSAISGRWLSSSSGSHDRRIVRIPAGRQLAKPKTVRRTSFTDRFHEHYSHFQSGEYSHRRKRCTYAPNEYRSSLYGHINGKASSSPFISAKSRAPRLPPSIIASASRGTASKTGFSFVCNALSNV